MTNASGAQMRPSTMLRLKLSVASTVRNRPSTRRLRDLTRMSWSEIGTADVEMIVVLGEMLARIEASDIGAMRLSRARVVKVVGREAKLTFVRRYSGTNAAR